MAKRFTDTDKWKKTFFRGLQAPHKILWLYLLDECNHAGIWEVEFDVMKLRTGISTSREEMLEVFKGKIVEFDDGHKWFIKDFIDFQYGVLNRKNKAHNSVLNLLDYYKNKGLISTLQGAKDKDKDNNKTTIKKIREWYRLEYDYGKELTDSEKDEYKKQFINRTLKSYGVFAKFLFEGNSDEPFDSLLKMPKQIRFVDYQKLYNKAESKHRDLKELALALYNDFTKYGKGKKSLYYTLNNWLNRK